MLNTLCHKIFGKRSSLQRKVAFVYFMATILPITLITIIICIVYYNNMLDTTNDFITQNGEQHSQIIEERLDTYNHLFYEILIDNELIDYTKELNNSISENNLIIAANIEDIFRNYIYTNNNVMGLSYFAENGYYAYYSRKSNSRYDSVLVNQISRDEIYNKNIDNDEIAYITPVNISNSVINPEYVVLICMPIKDLHSKEKTGILSMIIDDSVLSYDAKGDNIKGVEDIILNNNIIIAGDDDKYINYNYKTYISQKYTSTSNITEIKNNIAGTDWTVLNIIDNKLYMEEIYDLLKIIIIIVMTITFIFFILVYIMSHNYIVTIQKISELISQYKGSYQEEIVINIDKENELYLIANQFNKMMERINNQVEVLKDKNIEIEEAIVGQKNAEIKALEAQINPHFLFNTLNSINWKAIDHDEIEISNMLSSLGSLLRYSVSNIDMVVYLEAEINWLKKYIYLQKERFQSSFDCTYDISDEAMMFPIYKMLLQPIIENIIIHAFDNIKSGGMIDIVAFVKEDNLEIRIKDNGVGIKPEKLNDINKKIEMKKILNSKSIGIENVINRLRLYYHDEAEIIVKSELGKGTEFVLIIPEVKKNL